MVRSHCDASCDGTEHRIGGRVATSIMYCRAPELGGATIFPKSEIYIRPKKGMLTLIAYWGADGRTDPEGLTEHASCPIIEGKFPNWCKRVLNYLFGVYLGFVMVLP